MVHCILFSAILLSFLLSGKEKKLQILPVAVLFLFAALRYMYGNDYANYYYIHGSMQAGSESPFDEILFTKLFEIFPNFFVLIGIISGVFVFAVYKLLKRNLTALDMSIGLLIFVINPYLFLMNLSALRQCLAMALFLWAVEFGFRRKPVQYLLILLLATLFHKSAVILIPVYVILGPKPFKSYYVAATLLFLLALLWAVDISSIVQWAVEFFGDKNYTAHASSDLGNSVRATILTGISLIYVVSNLPKLEGRALVYSKLYLIGLMLGVLAFRMSMLTRIQMYFDIFSVVSIPAILRSNRGPVITDPDNVLVSLWRCVNKFVLPVLVFLVYALRYYAFFTNSSWKSFFEYQTIFSIL